MRAIGHFVRFILLLCARAVLIAGLLGSMATAWWYYGYQRVGCHPMFSSANIECGNVQALAAEHSLAMVRTLAPYQQTLRDHQSELILYGGAVVISAVAIEVLFGVFAIMRRRRAKRDLFKGATGIKSYKVDGLR